MSATTGMCAVSAVIPAYNAELFLGEAIKSVLAQTAAISEIIVVDEGSTDRTAEVAAQFPRTRVIRQVNGGQAAARNTGIRAATGTWIAFLDHDDVWFPHKTEVQMKLVRPDTGVVHADKFDPIHFGNLWHRQAYISPSGAVVRKAVLQQVGGFDESRSIQGVEDLNLWLKIALTEWGFVRSPADVFQWNATGVNQSGNDFKMFHAELACIAAVGEQVQCQRAEMDVIRQASRVEYAKGLIANKRWEDAARLLPAGGRDFASRWLALAGLLKINRLARTNLVRWLQTLDGDYATRTCSQECNLPEWQRTQCAASCRQVYWRPAGK
jgi:glycosyltransferase involved in cell wall biosynthesis